MKLSDRVQRARKRVGSRRASHRTFVGLLLALLTVLQISMPQAVLQIVWRAAVVSFDDPATQRLDEITLEKTSISDVLRDALRISRLAATAPSRVALPPAPSLARVCAERQFITRSPPIV